MPRPKEKLVADITYSTSEDGTEVIFKADTPEAEEYMGEAETTVRIGEAEDFKKGAEEAGLIVIPLR
jgi:hypothetical protein